MCASLKDFFTNGIIYNSLRSSTSVLRLFKIGSPLAEDLREILRAFVASRPDIGYVL